MSELKKLIHQKWVRRAGWIAGLLLLGLILTYFTFRNTLLQTAIHKIETRFHSHWGGELSIQDAHFNSWRSVNLQGIAVTTPEQDTLFTLSDLRVQLRIWPLFLGRALPASVSLHHGGIQIAYCDSLENNFRWLQRSEVSKADTTSFQTTTGLNKRFSDLVELAFQWLPDRLEMQDVSLRLDYVGNTYAFIADTVQLDKGSLHTAFTVLSPLLTQRGSLDGMVNRSQKSFDIVLSGLDGHYLSLPGFYEMGGLWTALKDARLRLSDLQTHGDQLTFQLFGQTDQLYLAHARLADSLVTLPLLAMQVAWKIGSQEIALDTLSSFTVDKVSGHFGGILQLHPYRKLALQVRIPPLPSQDFFTSLPPGMFGNLEGIQTSGTLDYTFDLMVREDSLDLTVLHSQLVGQDFKILEYGKTDLRKMNGTFLHQVYEEGRLTEQFLVGPQNPDWVPLEAVAPPLKDAILTCEDPSFFSHRGFLLDAIRESMIQNLKEKRFARGGSTISMQLVKNVFLSRKKFLARKLEEILLVWLIEGQRLTSKERMFETYLNLIEWGPGIYGIRQAAQFYFAKAPADLELSECLFLASIVPKPKKYRWYFEGTQLRPQWSEFNRFIANRMVSRGLIPPVDSLSFTGDVLLKGPALATLSVRDTIDVDSLEFLPLDLIPDKWMAPVDTLSGD
ncbi:MAG: transglycosylase domain-containing protein [Saprospiraceae bacterium]|nr:transglycosylase domain-containing protein [Saprospiraceae bacterium]